MLGLEAHYRSFVVGKGHTDTVRSPSDIHLATMGYEVEKSEEQWRAELGARYDVLREAATERAWTGELLDEERDGLYRCGACGNELFQSGTKFDSAVAGRVSTMRSTPKRSNCSKIPAWA